MPPNQTILKVESFEIEYYPLIQHVFPLILPCRNVILRSKNTMSEHVTISKNTVSERDTPIQKYRVRMLHSNLRIPCRNVTLRSNSIINLLFNITTFPFVNNI